MIELERHIEILLLNNDCVIVPGLGGFMTHAVDARYDAEDQLFLPPLRTLGFNPQLIMNDSLLAQSYVEAYDISYPEAVRRIESEVRELKQHLETDGFYTLNDIGTLSLNEEGRYEFSPCEAGILTPGLYGLSTFELSPVRQRGTIKALSGADGNGVAEKDRAIVIKMSWLRNAMAVAVALVAFLLMTTPIANSGLSQLQQSSMVPVVQPQSRTVVAVPSDTIAPQVASETAAADTTAEDTVAVDQGLQTAEGREYCIVLASHVSQRNADLFVKNLSESGYSDAYVFVRNKIVRVVYGTFPSESAAYNTLRQLRESGSFAEAWIMEK